MAQANCKIKVEKNIMTITIDLKKTLGPSKSGKTIMVASTSGKEDVAGVSVNLNVYKFPAAE